MLLYCTKMKNLTSKQTTLHHPSASHSPFIFIYNQSALLPSVSTTQLTNNKNPNSSAITHIASAYKHQQHTSQIASLSSFSICNIYITQLQAQHTYTHLNKCISPVMILNLESRASLTTASPSLVYSHFRSSSTLRCGAVNSSRKT